MMKVRLALFALGMIVVLPTFGQLPVITSVTPSTTYPGGKIVITGSGFSGTASQLAVWFDNVKGTITASSDFSIEVTVPVNARHGNIEVINLTSKLSAKSEVKFSPSYSGESLSTANAASKFSLLASSVSTHTSEILDVCTCDFNMDGLADLAGSVPENLANVVKLAQNTSPAPGTISFTATNLPFNFPTTNLACGDLNGDGKPDLIGTRGGANSNEVLIKTNNSTAGGSISFATSVIQLSVDAGDRAYRVVIHDVDKDGKPDLIVTNANNSITNPPANNIYLFRNTTNVSGSISFATPVKVPVLNAASTYGIEVQDLDADKKPEIIVNQFNSPDIFILKNNSSIGQIAFGEAQRIAVASSVFNHLITGDFNGDGKYDIAATNGGNANKAHVLINTTTTTFSFSALGPFTTGDGAFGIDAGDLDGDGDLDVVIGNQDFNPSETNTQITFLLNNGNTSVNFDPVIIDKGKKSRNIEIADFDRDGKLDIAFSSPPLVSGGSSSIEVLRNSNCFSPKILNDQPVTICNGQTIVLETVPNSGATFQWKNGGVDIAGQTTTATTITTIGDFSVATVSESGNCTNTTPVLSVTANTSSVTQDPVILNATAGVITVCPATDVQLSTSTTEPTYLWTGPNGFTSALQNPTLPAISATQAGIYTLQVINGVCKSNEATVRVDVASLESFAISSSVAGKMICEGGSLQLSTTVQAGSTYQWILNGADISGQTASALTVNTEGSYQVRVTSSLGCSVVTDAAAVKVLSLPVASFTSPATGCVGQDINLINTTTSDPDGVISYIWNFGNATTSSVTSPFVTYAVAQTFNVTLTASYSGVTGCSDNEPKSIVIKSPIAVAITASDLGVCPDAPVTLSVPASYTDVVWSSSATGNSLAVTAAGSYSVTANDENGCSSEASVEIIAKEVPQLTITTDPNPPTVAPGLTVQITAVGADSYAWTPAATLSSATSANPVATPLETTEYTVVGTITDGCSAEATVTIEVAGKIKVTNAFSPNGDGNNDLWVIPGIGNYVECTLTLFDSSGRKILEQRGYQNDWDGTYNGKLVPKGTYYFVIAGCPDKEPINGHLLVAY